MAGVEQEDAVVQKFLCQQTLAAAGGTWRGARRSNHFALDQPRQHVGLGVERRLRALRDQAFQVGQHSAHRQVAARLRFFAQDRLQRTEDRERPVAQRRALGMRNAEQVADDADRNRARKSLDQVDGFAGLGARLQRIEQATDQLQQTALHGRDVARREGARDQAAHARVQRRVVEHQAGGVVLEQD